MSRAPHALLSSRTGTALGHARLTDLMILDGLWDAFYDCHMATTVESMAKQLGITRHEQDAVAVESHRRAIAARSRGASGIEIVPMETTSGFVAEDERPRADTSLQMLGRLKPVFAEEGTITAGNASGINDGAAVAHLSSTPPSSSSRLRFQIAASKLVGVDPAEMGVAPVVAVREMLRTSALAIGDIALWEINEAFAAQIIAVQKQLEISWDRLNVNGGAIALGHPIGCSGARVLASLLHEMVRREAEHGIAAVCVGGGLGLSVLVRQV